MSRRTVTSSSGGDSNPMAQKDSLGVTDFTAIPPEFGTTPIPEGHVRFNHYTSESKSRDDDGNQPDDNTSSIKRHGLLNSYAQRSYARGGSEAPFTFMTAGNPNPNSLSQRNWVEGYIHPSQLGGFASDRTPADLEANKAVLTTLHDIPPEQILHVHEPWHNKFRTMRESYAHEMLNGEMDFVHDDPDTKAEYGKALDANKVVLAQQVMLGGTLGPRRGTGK